MFSECSAIEFYSLKLDINSFPVLKDHGARIFSLFGTTYRCEQFFSKMKYVKNSYRNRIGNERLESCLRIASTEMKVDIDSLEKERKRNGNQ